MTGEYTRIARNDRHSKSLPICASAAPRRTSGLAFRHPLAGDQWVKGTIEPGEDPHATARRELYEESGLLAPAQMNQFGDVTMGNTSTRWHLYACGSEGLPDTWQHETADDGGHIFSFFWHQIDAPLGPSWDPQFQCAYRALQEAVVRGLWASIADSQVIKPSDPNRA